MEDTLVSDAQKDCQGREDSLHSLSEEKDLSGENNLNCSRSKCDRLLRRANSQQTLVLDVKQLQRSKSCMKGSFLRSIQVLDNWIPKHVMAIDEKYLRHCLELLHLSASRPTPCIDSLNWGWENIGVLSDSLNLAKAGSGSSCNLSRFEFDSSLEAGSGSMVVSPAGQWIIGSVMDSKSMVNILKSPLLRQYGAYDGDAESEKPSLNDIKRSLSYDFMSSPGGLSNYSLSKLDKEAQIPRNNRQGYEIMHEQLHSMSSSNSTCSDHSSSSFHSATVTRGMLQCSWKDGKPHFIFSLDEQKVVYEANLLCNESADNMDHMYLIHSRMGGKKEHVINNDSVLIGKMKVSTSFTLCPNDSRIMEREFVLFGRNENRIGEFENSSHDLKKSKGLSKKVADVFRSSQSFKKRTISKFGGSSAILENCSWEPVQDADKSIDGPGGGNLSENLLPPNLELAAIIVKDHLPEIRQEKVGGWGLKFLKKVGAKQSTGVMESSGCARDTGDCSTSMDVLIPAGIHGGPRTRNGGPSSLVERWRSGGRCECGGWDLGCPLTLFKCRLSNKELSSETDALGECKLIDLLIQGSEKTAPPLRMVNVHSGLYFVNFHSTLSALQSFSIAVAFVHAHSPALRPKSVKEIDSKIQD